MVESAQFNFSEEPTALLGMMPSGLNVASYHGGTCDSIGVMPSGLIVAWYFNAYTGN